MKTMKTRPPNLSPPRSRWSRRRKRPSKRTTESEPIDTEGAHTASAEEIDYSGVLERGTKENCWSMKLKPGVPASTFEQQSLYGPFDIEKCLAWCLDPPYGPPRVAIIRHVSFCLLAGGQAVYDGLTQIQTVLGRGNSRSKGEQALCRAFASARLCYAMLAAG